MASDEPSILRDGEPGGASESDGQTWPIDSEPPVEETCEHGLALGSKCDGCERNEQSASW